MALAASLTSAPARALDDVVPGESYTWQAQVRGAYVIPSNSHLPLPFNLNGAVVGELAGEWFFLPHWSTELDVASPAHLNVSSGAGAISLTTQTWTAKYYFAATNGLTPYVQTGIYHASASRDNTQPNIGVGNPGFGWTIGGGVTYGIAPNAFVSLDVRYMNGLEPTLIVDGAPSGHIGIDPIVVGVGLGLRY